MRLAASVLMVIFASLVEVVNMKVDWRYALMINGEQSAKLDGMLLVLQQYANSSDIPILEVSNARQKP